jgi:hypothetical protein
MLRITSLPAGAFASAHAATGFGCQRETPDRVMLSASWTTHDLFGAGDCTGWIGLEQ